MRSTFLLLYLFAIVLFSACSETSLIGEELIPDSDLNLVEQDTFAIKVFTETENEFSTDSLSTYVLGSLDQNDFGRTLCGFYTQVRLPANNIDLGNSPVADSLVLQLDYAAFYGDTAAAQTIRVLELSEAFDASTDYLSTSTLTTEPVEIGSIANKVHNINDSLEIGGVKIEPHLRINLSDELAQRLVDQSEGTNFENNDNFLEFFKGIYIDIDENESDNKLLVNYNLASSLSAMVLYYHNENDTLVLSFPINNSSIKFNSIEHDYAGATIETFVNQSTSNGDSIGFVQGLGGVNTKIEFPGVKELGDVIIKRASLEIVDLAKSDEDTLFNSPGTMFLSRRPVGTNNFAIIQDYAFDSGNYDVGGELIQDVDDNGNLINVYNFNLAVYMQDLIEGKEDNADLFLVPAGRRELGNRTIIGGGNHPDYPMKLTLTYSVID